ncbi:hypothetical protein EDC45_0170 [Mesocricetibacter intestinalis]|uniref:Uncharacterized protein n=1 Tax=Mesocricetibacter intestinalis TaxID=1521930 RepID=A0A4R6VL39_9PAST|nr:hypothetical protein EDC45_0170 [Mesocricetibacter intestinalis]
MLLMKNQRIFYNIPFFIIGVSAQPLAAFLFLINHYFRLSARLIQMLSRSNYEESRS